MEEKYDVGSLNQLFDDTLSILINERKLNDLERLNDEKNSKINYNTILLSQAIVKLLKDVLLNIQVSRKDYGEILPKELKKYYAFGELKDKKEVVKTNNDSILSIFDDETVDYPDNFNFETPSYYQMKYDEVMLVLNFSSSLSYSNGSYLRDGGNLEYDYIDLELLKRQLEKYGITAKLHRQIGLDTSGLQTINTILLELHYYRYYEKNKIK